MPVPAVFVLAAVATFAARRIKSRGTERTRAVAVKPLGLL